MSFSAATFRNCRFIGNSGGLGGAILCELSDPVVFDHCEFTRNSAVTGGALQISEASAVFEGCTFTQNHATDNGGAITVAAATSTLLSQCTLSDNGAANGGGLYIWGSDVRIANSIVAFSKQGESIDDQYGAVVSLVCSDLYGNPGGDWVGGFADQLGQNGNICRDPRFCGNGNPEHPFTLWTDSPCAPDQNPECGLIGAWPIECDTAGIPTSETTNLDLRAIPKGERFVTLHYRVPDDEAVLDVRLDIHDVLGRRIVTLVNGPMSAGEYAATWDARDRGGRLLPGGVYLARLRAGSDRTASRVVLVR
jgi:predicted outer membrane repeat protein